MALVPDASKHIRCITSNGDVAAKNLANRSSLILIRIHKREHPPFRLDNSILA